MDSQASENSSSAIVYPTELAEYQQWESDTTFFTRHSPDDFILYMMQTVPFAGAACVLQLLWPCFIEHRGCVIRRDAFEEKNFEEWWSHRAGDVQAIESVMNHLHLLDLFPMVNGDEIAEEALEQMARRMQQTWRQALAERFPNRHFKVELDDSYGPTLCFFSVPDRPRTSILGRLRGQRGR